MFRNRIMVLVLGLMFGAPMVSSSVLAEEGAVLYKERNCIACHGKEGKEPAMNSYPKLAGQTEPYLLSQMQAIKSGTRANSHSKAMTNIMDQVSDEEMAVIAKWLAGIK